MMTDDREAKLMKLDRILFSYLYRLKPDDVNIALFHAITSGDSDLARTSLEKGANPKLQDGDIILQHVEDLLNSELRDVFREWLATIHGHDLSLEEKRSNLLAQLIYFLYKEHADDVNLAFWYAVKTNDLNLARTCVERGGDPNIVDTAAVWPHRDALLASPLADTFLEWFLIAYSPQQPPNLATLMQAFLMVVQSRYSTRILELGERLLAEMDTDAEMAANAGLKVRVQFSLATALLESPAGDREENLLNSMRYFEKVLSLLPSTDAPTFDPHDPTFDPQLWWQTQANMATAYSRLSRGDRAENIERSIHHYQQALRLLAFGDSPQERILVCNNLANAYRNSIRGDPAANIERAIDFCLEALTYVDLPSLSAEQQLAPHQQASILGNLAACYGERVFGDRAENLERSIAYFGKALDLW
jgi:hypothetical protein